MGIRKEAVTPPVLKLPEMGPLTRTAVLYDSWSDSGVSERIDWDSEVRLIIDHRLASVTLRIVRDFNLMPPEHIRKQLQDAAFAWTEASCIASKKASTDLSALGDRGFPYVVTKGPGIAVHAPHFGERPFSDIDVFVQKKSFSQALSI